MAALIIWFGACFWALLAQVAAASAAAASREEAAAATVALANGGLDTTQPSWRLLKTEAPTLEISGHCFTGGMGLPDLNGVYAQAGMTSDGRPYFKKDNVWHFFYDSKCFGQAMWVLAEFQSGNHFDHSKSGSFNAECNTQNNACCGWIQTLAADNVQPLKPPQGERSLWQWCGSHGKSGPVRLDYSVPPVPALPTLPASQQVATVRRLANSLFYRQIVVTSGNSNCCPGVYHPVACCYGGSNGPFYWKGGNCGTSFLGYWREHDSWYWSGNHRSDYTYWPETPPRSDDSFSGGACTWHYATTITTTIATTATTTTTTTNNCKPGRFRNGALCTPCPAGTYTEGGRKCLPVLAAVVSNLSAPALHVEQLDNFNRVYMRIELPSLPTEVYEGGSLRFIADMGTDADALRIGTTCGDLWKGSSSLITITLTYAQLSGTCAFNVTDTNDNILRHSIVGVFLVHYSSAGTKTTVQLVIFPVKLVFPRAVFGSFYAVQSWSPVHINEKRVEMGPFSAILQIFQSNTYQQTKQFPLYRVGDIVYAEHSVNNTEVKLVPQWVWLSRSSNPEDLTELQHNLSTQVLLLTAPLGRVRFTFAARLCTQCWLHVVSHVEKVTDGRRLLWKGYALHSSTGMYIHQSDSLNGGANAADARQRVSASTNSKHIEEDALPNLIPEAYIAIPMALGSSMAFALLTRFTSCILARKLGQEERHTLDPGSLRAFFVIEGIDLLTESINFASIHFEGDLDFANDGGSIRFALLGSISLSSTMYTLEWVAMCIVGRDNFRQWLPLLTTLHLAFEDAFQLIVYSCVTASQTSEEMGTTAAGCAAIVLTLIGLIAKSWSLHAPAFDRWFKGGYEAAVEE